MLQVLLLDDEMLALAEQLRHATSLLMFGRGFNYATALEAALKVQPLPACLYWVSAGPLAALHGKALCARVQITSTASRCIAAALAQSFGAQKAVL